MSIAEWKGRKVPEKWRGEAFFGQTTEGSFPAISPKAGHVTGGFTWRGGFETFRTDAIEDQGLGPWSRHVDGAVWQGKQRSGDGAAKEFERTSGPAGGSCERAVESGS